MIVSFWLALREKYQPYKIIAWDKKQHHLIILEYDFVVKAIWFQRSNICHVRWNFSFCDARSTRNVSNYIKYANYLLYIFQCILDYIQMIIFGLFGKQDRSFIQVFWNLFTYRLKTRFFVNRKSSFSPLNSSTEQ